MPAKPYSDAELAEIRAEARLMGIHPGDAEWFSRLLATIDRERADASVAVLREQTHAEQVEARCAAMREGLIEVYGEGCTLPCLAHDAGTKLFVRMRALEEVAKWASDYLPEDGEPTQLGNALDALDKVPR